MPPAERHRIRHKGIVQGPLARAEILERLAAGEYSLAHLVEVRDKWMTLRQHLRESAVASPHPAPAGGRPHPGAPPRPTEGEIPPPPPGAPRPAPTLDQRIRSGYLWCGLTFGLPFVALAPLWLLRGELGMGPALEALAFAAVALACTGYALSRAWSVSRRLEAEGVADVAASLRNLSAGLSAGSGLFWLTALALAA